MEILVGIGMFILGAIFGSFACCQAWRLRYKQDGKEDLGSRSVCLSCGHKLAWHENVPVLSWVFLRGRCKKCKCFIGWAEILSEIGLGAVFLLMYMVSGLTLQLLILLVTWVGFWIILVYDAKWGEMPVRFLVACIISSGAYFVVDFVGRGGGLTEVAKFLGGFLMLPMIYFILYKISHERLVGSGDWLLCVSLSLLLGDFWLCLIELFLANLFGSICGIPGLILKKEHKLHFAPFLLMAFLVVFMLKDWLLSLVRF